jgi:glycosyltransferase involved in cell wall biosynthesis
LRVAQVSPRTYPDVGGVERHVMMISKGLVNRGVKLEILTTDPTGQLPKEEILDRVRVRRFRSWAPGGPNYHFSGDLKKFLSKHSADYDIVHAHSYHDLPALYAAETKASNRLIFTPHYHGTGHTLIRSLLHLPYKLVAKMIFERADRIVCVSEYEKHLLNSHFRIPDSKVVVIPNGVDFAEFQPHAHEDLQRHILYVGRLEKYKRVDRLIGAMRYLDTSFRLEIVGNGPAMTRLEKLVRKLNARDRIRFLEFLPRDELLKKYASANVFVTLSDHEAYGLAVAEAMAAGTPCVVANNSALREWVDDNGCLGVDNTDDPFQVAALIRRAIGRKVVNPRIIDWQDVGDALLGVYEKLLEADPCHNSR